MPEGDFLPIGELARRTGLAPSALRYYERVGLLRPAGREGGKRFYASPSAERVALIRLCQDAGFTLSEIGRLIPALRRGGRRLGHIAERKISELEARIAAAQRAKRLIEQALECPHRDRLTCPGFRSALEDQLQESGGLSVGGGPVDI